MGDEEVAEAEIVEGPDSAEPLLRLRASIYETDKGSLLLAFRVEGMQHDGYFVMAPTMVKLLAKLARVPGGKNPIDLLRQARAELDRAKGEPGAD
ncbi:MAG: hypothetical protein M0010_00655 [Actinomycetota bacterium]|nr:hypothetical protein [Actinomycetota bacterium]